MNSNKKTATAVGALFLIVFITSLVGSGLVEDILYAPDYIVNAGGLISVVDEYEHKGHRQKRVLERIAIIPKNLRKILARSKRSHRPPFEIANEMAEKIFNKY